MIEITVNGQGHELAENLSIEALLEHLGHGDRRVAVERNGEIVPRSRHGAETVGDGDRIEIVHAIGGG